MKGDVILRTGFRAEGEVRLLGAQIGGDLDCSTGTFSNPAQADNAESGTALSADGAVVKGSVFLRDGFHTEGEVRLLGAQIGGTLHCIAGAFTNPSQQGNDASGKALAADRAVVKGSVFLRNGFRAEGEVRLPSVQIGRDLDCTECTLDGTLFAQALIAKGGLLWFGIINPERATLDLRDASVSALVDTAKSWPGHGKLILDGFTYERISAGPRDAKSRLDWLARQDPFAPQPYRHLAKVLRGEGDDTGARQVLFEMERLRRKAKDHGWLARIWTVVLRLIVGFGRVAHPSRRSEVLGCPILAVYPEMQAKGARVGKSPLESAAHLKQPVDNYYIPIVCW